MPALLIGTCLGLVAAALSFGAGLGPLAALGLHGLVGGMGTLGIAWLQWQRFKRAPEPAFEPQQAG